jgi:hypothetical protein
MILFLLTPTKLSASSGIYGRFLIVLFAVVWNITVLMFSSPEITHLMREEKPLRHVGLNFVLLFVKLQTFVPWLPNTDILFCSMMIRTPQQFSARCSPIADSSAEIFVYWWEIGLFNYVFTAYANYKPQTSCCVHITVIKLFFLFFLVTGFFFLARLLWNQRWFLPTQASRFRQQ